MTEAEVEIIVRRAREQFPSASPQISSDNGPGFMARNFKEFTRLCRTTHGRTFRNFLPFCPQSSGKMEKLHQSLKGDSVHPGVPCRSRLITVTDKAGREIYTPEETVHLEPGKAAVFSAVSQISK